MKNACINCINTRTEVALPRYRVTGSPPGSKSKAGFERTLDYFKMMSGGLSHIPHKAAASPSQWPRWNDVAETRKRPSWH